MVTLKSKLQKLSLTPQTNTWITYYLAANAKVFRSELNTVHFHRSIYINIINHFYRSIYIKIINKFYRSIYINVINISSFNHGIIDSVSTCNADLICSDACEKSKNIIPHTTHPPTRIITLPKKKNGST